MRRPIRRDDADRAVDVVADPYDAVEAERRDLERAGAVERRTIGGECVRPVTEADDDDAPAETRADGPVGTATRDQPTAYRKTDPRWPRRYASLPPDVDGGARGRVGRTATLAKA